ncbi:hypothetical protein FJU08_22285 [Martelella alba]|uniref:Uncharacterized protein n=1 Tax=Martelella alba TaxID=2590451 RepID=A0A506U0A6_9HYPH|nr:hypothetical protein [Martelella alba]TPW26414.1 hypothetical protein FJU08_22285 [Martelella alba]
MDPIATSMNMRTQEIVFALFQLIVLALVLERGLFIAFDVKYWRDRINGGTKAIVTIALAFLICWRFSFDLMARVLDMSDASTLIGISITAFIVAGGSAGAMRLMQDFLGLSRTARDAAKAEQTAKKERAEAERIEAETRKRTATI